MDKGYKLNAKGGTWRGDKRVRFLPALGAVLGFVLYAAGSKWLAATLFEVHAYDPASLSGALGILLTAAAAAVW